MTKLLQGHSQGPPLGEFEPLYMALCGNGPIELQDKGRGFKGLGGHDVSELFNAYLSV